MDDPSGSKFSDSSLQDLMGEHASRPSVAPWAWCIEYVAKFKKDLHRIRAMMNVSLDCPVDLGKRTNEVVALRILEFMFTLGKQHSDGTPVASASEPRVEFDLSSSSIDVLKAILKEIPLAELRPGMSELTKFNVLPFIAHKNSCIPRCALERLRDAVLEENQTIAAPCVQASEHDLGDEQPMHVDEQPKQVGEEAMHIDQEAVHMKDVEKENQRNAHSFAEASEPVLRGEQPGQIRGKPMHRGEEAVPINEQAKAIIIDDDDDDDEPMQRNKQVNVVVIDGECENNEAVEEATLEPTNNVNTESNSGSREGDVSVRCGKAGTWLISGSRDVLSTVQRECLNSSSICPNGDRSNISENPPSSSRARQDILLCVKCGKDGTLLVCSSPDCSVKVHQECLNGPVWLNEKDNFHCPQCHYDRVTSEYLQSKNSLQAAKKNLVMFHRKVSTINKRLVG
ncbi:PREDICTED: uncharacterized protein LOC104805090 [Tarenaya hassleriana]|uniref:uncharacterized protein LOC104805090 n=1 Tax=Tarenaya hassleriana TaxID=28532 RepID=UPI00053C145D|nr:PREDICTED: uncharacterized protein LOC104805090 [Tarenaya hassleriana]